MSGAWSARSAVLRPAYRAVFSYQVCFSLMPGFLASNCRIASSTKERLGISAAQWLQNVSSLTCCAWAVSARPATKAAAAISVEGMLGRIGFLQRGSRGRRDLGWSISSAASAGRRFFTRLGAAPCSVNAADATMWRCARSHCLCQRQATVLPGSCRKSMRPEEGAHVAHGQGNPVLGFLPGVEAHFGLRRKQRRLHGHRVGVSRDVVR